ncbi:MAG: diguanylate cyclase [Acidobacteriia bacterium]|nr:diguanylate cyclase [Terriglobia bacterium]
MGILIAEDDAVSRRMLEATLKKWGYDVVVTEDGDKAWEVLQREDAPRLAILDWVMPGLHGPQICRAVRSLGDQRYVYLLLLTAKSEKEDLVKGLEAGADDFLTKPFDAEELRARLRAGIRILDLQETLRVQATHDSLTGLWNRGATLDLLRRELSRGERQGTPVTVIMADIDHFKQVNDMYGHLTGDVVLREVAHRLSSAVRGYDVTGRFGGEEFLIVFPGCTAQNAILQAERLRARILKEPVDTPEGPIPVTLSLGVAASEPVTEVDPDLLLRAADTALYRAKSRGRNCVELATAVELRIPSSPTGSNRRRAS